MRAALPSVDRVSSRHNLRSLEEPVRCWPGSKGGTQRERDPLEIDRWKEDGEKVVVATVVATRRSAPRPIGASLAISESGRCAAPSPAAASRATSTRTPRRCSRPASRSLSRTASRRPRLERRPAVRGRDRRVPRAGRIVGLIHRLAELRESEGRGILFTGIEGDEAGRRCSSSSPASGSARGFMRRSRSSTSSSAGDATPFTLDDGSKIFAEWYGPPPRLFVYGAVDRRRGDVPRREALGWHAIVADARVKFATPERIPSADELIVKWPQEALAQVQPDTRPRSSSSARRHQFDEPALIGALETEAFYIGALGSRRNQERRRERLLTGVDESALDRIMGPCGLDIGADTCEETALSILAEILAVRGQREGGFLERTRRSASTSRSNSHSAGRLALGRARQVAPPHVGRRGGPRRHRHPWRSPLLPRGRRGRALNAKRVPPLPAVRAELDDGRPLLRFPDASEVVGDVELGPRIVTSFFGRPVEGRLIEGPWNDALSAYVGRPGVRLARTEREGDGVDRGRLAGSHARLDRIADALRDAAGERVRRRPPVPDDDRHRRRRPPRRGRLDRPSCPRRRRHRRRRHRRRRHRSRPRCPRPRHAQHHRGVSRRRADARAASPSAWCEVVDPGRVAVGDLVEPRSGRSARARARAASQRCSSWCWVPRTPSVRSR